MESSSSVLYILVIAHPDDESMFFIPTIRNLVSSGMTLWLLCLTMGDYNGLGKVREKELREASQLLGIKKTEIRSSTLQDHPSQRWSIPQVTKEILTALTEMMMTTSDGTTTMPSWKRIILLTFDNVGVSEHVNHVDTQYGVCSLVENYTTIGSCSSSKMAEIPIEAWQLESERNMFRKYLPIMQWVWLILSFLGYYTRTNVPCSTPRSKSERKQQIYNWYEPKLNWSAMATHRSQFVWYRRLFVIFSCYTYQNKLRPISGARRMDT